MRSKDLRPFSIKTIDNYYEHGKKKNDFFKDLESFLKKKSGNQKLLQ